MVKHLKGHWALPKGHPESNESPKETAARELFEETALTVTTFLDIPEEHELYSFREGAYLIDKKVSYFAALVSGRPRPQEAEIAECLWVDVEKASELATFPATKQLCERLHTLLAELNKKKDVIG